MLDKKIEMTNISGVGRFRVLAHGIISWCKKNHAWEDCTIYFWGKAWSTSPERNGVKGFLIAKGVYEYYDVDPCDYFDYANPKTLSMSFEGRLYDILNGYSYDWNKREEEFLELFNRYGLYYELGNSWNLTACESY